VADERDRLAREIERLNRTLGQDAKVVIELVRWETHTWPGFGEDAQAVINQQIAPYDIFVGIMWRRLGTPTGRGASGTVEEFERAYELWKTHRRPHIMFYFNRAAVEPQTEADRSQSAAVRAFKNVVSRRGGLWHEYDGVQDFADRVHEHLYSEVRQLLEELRPSAPDATIVAKQAPRDAAAAPGARTEAMARERKLVTVLYADLVVSTDVTVEHDAEVVRETVDDALATIERILARHGGTAQRFIGDAVMAVFGTPRAHEDDADRAVRAAFSIRDAVAALPVPGQHALGIRIGINTGDALTGGAGADRILVEGEPVVAGARLQQAAAPGEILVGPVTRHLTEGGIRYGAARRVDAKGLAGQETWPALEISTALPEEHRGLPGLWAPLIGRDREIRFLHEAFARSETDDRAYMVTIFGQPGSGKTRLADEFVSSLGKVRVRRGRCLSYGEGVTYYPLMLVIRADAGILPSDSKVEALDKLRTAGTEAFGDSPDADPVLQRVSVVAGLARPGDVIPVAAANLAEELRWGVRRYLERRAGDSPLVLVFEDVHWAEPALLDVIEYLLESSRARLFILCLARPDFRDLRPTWGGGATNAAAIDLAPLNAISTRALIAGLLLREALPEVLRTEIVSRAEGNPLYVEEFLRMLIDDGRIAQRNGKWEAVGDASALATPSTLQGLITARLDRVSGDVKQLLQRASIPSRIVSTAALAALGDGRPPPPELLREATRRDLLIELDEPAVGGGRAYRFKHALIRDVAYSTLPKSERCRLQDAYGWWREKVLGDRSAEVVEVIAYHAEQAYLIAKELGFEKAEDLGHRAFALLRTAAGDADRRDDAHAARALFRRASVIAAGIRIPARDAVEVQGSVALQGRRTESTPATKAALLSAIEAARAVGPCEILVHMLAQAALDGALGHEERQQYAAEAKAVAWSLGDAELVAAADFVRGFTASTFEEAYGVFKASYESQLSSGARRTLPKTLAILGVDAAKLGRFGEGFQYREEALRLARSSGSRVLLVEALYRLGIGEEHVGELPRALTLAQELLAVSTELGIALYEMQARLLLGLVLEEFGDRARAVGHFQEVFDRATSLGIPFLSGAAACLLVRIYLSEGRIDLADRYVPVKFEDPQLERGPLVPMRLEARAEIRAARGDDARAEVLFGEALALFDSLRDGANQAEARRTYTRFLMARGRGREAREHVEWLLQYYAEPIAERQRRVAEDLMRQIEASSG